MTTQTDVVNAYSRSLQLKIRLMELEKQGREETSAEQDERLKAICHFNTLETQYLAEHT